MFRFNYFVVVIAHLYYLHCVQNSYLVDLSTVTYRISYRIDKLFLIMMT